MSEYIVGYFQLKVTCPQCQKEIDKINNSFTMDTYTLLNLDLDDRYDVKSADYEPLLFPLCEQCEEASTKKQSELWEKERLQIIRDGLFIKCSVCGKNTREHPETEFQEHHLSYSPEKKINVCKSCHNKIHNTDDYPDLKPKDKRASREE